MTKSSRQQTGPQPFKEISTNPRTERTQKDPPFSVSIGMILVEKGLESLSFFMELLYPFYIFVKRGLILFISHDCIMRG